MKRTVCIPIDRRNECRERRHPGHECGSGIGREGDPMYTLTAMSAEIAIPAVCAWEEDDMDTFAIEGNGCRPSHLGSGISGKNAPMYTLNTTEVHGVMAYERDLVMLESHPNDSRLRIDGSGCCQTLSSRMGTGGNNTPMMMEDNNMGHYVVRRITPKECCRLQGFPDNWTAIGDWVDQKGKLRKTTDAARYKALGNSMAVPVMRFIGERIDWALAHPITEDTSKPVDWQPDLF